MLQQEGLTEGTGGGDVSTHTCVPLVQPGAQPTRERRLGRLVVGRRPRQDHGVGHFGRADHVRAVEGAEHGGVLGLTAQRELAVGGRAVGRPAGPRLAAGVEPQLLQQVVIELDQVVRVRPEAVGELQSVALSGHGCG